MGLVDEGWHISNDVETPSEGVDKEGLQGVAVTFEEPLWLMALPHSLEHGLTLHQISLTFVFKADILLNNTQIDKHTAS